MQKSVPRSFSTELNLPRCVPGTPESADPVLVSHDANQALKQPTESVVGAAHPKIYYGILGRSSKQALRAEKDNDPRVELVDKLDSIEVVLAIQPALSVSSVPPHRPSVPPPAFSRNASAVPRKTSEGLRTCMNFWKITWFGKELLQVVPPSLNFPLSGFERERSVPPGTGSCDACVCAVRPSGSHTSHCAVYTVQN